MRGEHSHMTTSSETPTGSSPHARGARMEKTKVTYVDGIIPACAGSTPRARHRDVHRRDHPRMRGEHSPERQSRTNQLGSSPHARGALHRLVGRVDVVGIIPACAGSTFHTRAGANSRRDHPRMRGEHSPLHDRTFSPTGSSPHARGALVYEMCRLNPSGIIPACAGSTSRRARCS